ncbi:hypothetical protein LO763_11655 [Glycomyces sp. A-F 0318]|uniref:hypothetical protein n=1 Tax=Glycomyces amatae TaxID=2881355 RepID=UPI001E5EC8D4|nr:hypothetical protein [Glycomyces amatae]MCD0444277.1 hypothetical protein [Glycomyces amatae]
MTHSVRWDINQEPLASAEEAAAFIDEQLAMVNPHGTHSVTLWFGPEGAKRRDMPLRIDLDPEAGAAAVRWVPEGLIAVDPDLEPRDITVCQSSDRPLVIIPAALARTGIETARQIAIDYVRTGQRPDGIEWWPPATD